MVEVSDEVGSEPATTVVETVRKFGLGLGEGKGDSKGGEQSCPGEGGKWRLGEGCDFCSQCKGL